MPDSDGARLAVSTTVYPQAAPYLDELAASLRDSRTRAHRVYMVNDGLDAMELRERFRGLDLVLVPGGGTPANNRARGFEALIEDDVKRVVFADADDTFSPDRIEESAKALAHHAVVFNEIRMDDGVGLLAGRIPAGSRVGWRDILDLNFLGLSNTAVRLDALRPHVERVGHDADVVDWPLFTRILHAGVMAFRLPVSETHYRRHPGSFAVLEATSDAALRRAVEVKARHYSALRALGPEFEARAAYFAALNALDEAAAEWREYVKQCRAARPTRALWWEIALYPNDEDR